MNVQVRTDLALEARESVSKSEARLNGVRMEEHFERERGLRVTRVEIRAKNAARALGKPMGKYVTIETGSMWEESEESMREISVLLAKEIKNLLPEKHRGLSVLVVGLGNREVTADSLGPKTLEGIRITRHIVKTYGKAAYGNEQIHLVSGVEPGVMGRTGMETAEILKGIISETKPDLLIAVDALAARNTRRLNRTIQVTDSGIQPGSGVGNHRNALTREELGIPVIAIGVPTVVDAATIVSDAVERCKEKQKGRESLFFVEESGIGGGELRNLYMTGKDIDAVICRVGKILSQGINLALDVV